LGMTIAPPIPLIDAARRLNTERVIE